MSKPRTMYVRFVGTKICYTVDDGRFVFAFIDEATPEELAVCKRGGGDIPLSEVISFLAH